MSIPTSAALLASSFFLCACAGSAPPPAADAPPPVVATPPAPRGAETSGAVASAPAPAAAEPTTRAPDVGCEPALGVDVAATFRPLFEKGRRVRYAVVDDVDPHGPDGGHSVTKGKISCVVRSLRRFHDAVGSELVCAYEGEAGSEVPTEDLIFLANDRGLWMALGHLSDEAAAQKTLSEPPLYAAKPKSGRRTFEQGEDRPNTCTAAVEVNGANVCADTRCKVPVGYGDSQDRSCFSAARGLESWRRVNLAGPRTTTWKLADVGAGGVPPQSASAGPAVPPCADSGPPK